MDIVREELRPGVFLSCLQTGKFKSDCLSVSLLTALDRETVSKNALLPRVLARGTARYPDLDALSAACDELYGARVLPVVRKKGEILSVGFYAGFIADRYAPGGERLLESVASLLGEMLLSPATRGGLLRPDYVESERDKLLEDIRARVNDKRSYAVYRLIENMCAYEPYGCDDMGDETGAESVDHVSLTRWYHDLLKTAPIEIFYCGGADRGRVAAALRHALAPLPRGEINYDLGTDVRMNALEPEPRFFEETMDVSQGKLCLGFRLGDCMEDPDFAAIRVFNALYGGSVTSKLFLNVREKLSLCYYASSGCDSRKGIMLVSSGIEPENFEVAKAEILAQLDAVRNGDFTEEDLESARKCVAGDLRSLTDSPGALEDFYLSQTLIGLEMGPRELAALCEEVTAEDVKAVAAGIVPDAVYFLHGGEDGEEEDSDGEA
ncbi:MAG: insulinase family protein [Oscillospiraceae bacterium]|nr:insulinase family protein [Oscillospiraceae bacterium]